MFTVLMRHEVKQTYRTLLVILGIVAAIVATAAVLLLVRLPIVSALGFASAAVALGACPFVVLGYFAFRYYQTMYGQTGYFTMTIPVVGRTLFWVKSLWAFLVALGTYLVVTVGALVLVMAQERRSLASVLAGFSDQMSVRLLLVVGALIVVQLVCTIAIGALVISLGMSSRFNHMGMGGIVLVGVIAYFATQFIVAVGLLFIPVGVAIDPAGGGTLVWEGSLGSIISALQGGTPLPVIGLGSILCLLGLGVAAVIWTINLIERHTALR